MATHTIDAMLDQFRAQSDEVRALLAPLSDEQVVERPAPEAWSVGEHIEHLAVANRLYVEPIRSCIRDARARGLTGGPPYRDPLFGRLFIWSLEPPVRVRFRTFASMQPPPARELTRRRVVDDFIAVQEEIEGLLEGARGVDLGRGRMRSPVAKSVRLTLAQAFRVMLAHNRRHIWHVRRAIGRAGT